MTLVITAIDSYSVKRNRSTSRIGTAESMMWTGGSQLPPFPHHVLGKFAGRSGGARSASRWQMGPDRVAERLDRR